MGAKPGPKIGSAVAAPGDVRRLLFQVTATWSRGDEHRPAWFGFAS